MAAFCYTLIAYIRQVRINSLKDRIHYRIFLSQALWMPLHAPDGPPVRRLDRFDNAAALAGGNADHPLAQRIHRLMVGGINSPGSPYLRAPGKTAPLPTHRGEGPYRWGGRYLASLGYPVSMFRPAPH